MGPVAEPGNSAPATPWAFDPAPARTRHRQEFCRLWEKFAVGEGKRNNGGRRKLMGRLNTVDDKSTATKTREGAVTVEETVIGRDTNRGSDSDGQNTETEGDIHVQIWRETRTEPDT